MSTHPVSAGAGVISNRHVLEAALEEFATVGASQFRLKRVAVRADVSIGLLSDRFGNREGLIIAAALYRTSELMHRVFGALSESGGDGRLIPLTLEELVTRLTAPELWERDQAEREEFLRLAGLLCANAPARAEFEENRRPIGHLMLERAQGFVDDGLLAEGMTAVTFTRIVYGVLYGQVFFSGQSLFEIVADDWARALQLTIRGLFRTVPEDESD